MRYRQIAIGLLVVSLVVPTPVTAGFSGEPQLSVDAPDNSVAVGEETALTLQVSNFGEVFPFGFPDEPPRDPRSVSQLQQQVKTARNVRVKLQSGDAPLEVKTGTLPLGVVRDGTVVPAQFRIDVHGNATPGTYRLPVRIRYEYDERVTNAGVIRDQERTTERFRVAVEITPGASFRIVDVASDVRAGETGDLRMTVENVGTRTAREASLRLTATDAALGFGSPTRPNASRFLGRVAPGERTTLAYRVTAAPAPRREPHTLRAHVAYVDEDNRSRLSRPLSVGVAPTPEPSFALEDLQADLRVDQRGRVTGTLVNAGSTPVRDAVVVLEPTSDSLRPVASRYPVGTLAAGEGVEFSFPVDVPPVATAGPEQVRVRVEYATADGDRTSDPLRGRSRIEPEREPFEIRAVNATFEPDSEGNRLVLAVTNAGPAPRTDVVVRLTPRPPFTSTGPIAYVGRLTPGQTVEVAVPLTVGEDVVESTSPIAVNVTSDTDRREDALDGPYLVPVEIRERRGPSANTSLLVGGVLLAIVVVVGGWWWLRS